MFVPEPAHRSFQAQGESGTLLGPMGSPQLQAWGRNVLCPSAWEGRRGREKLPGSWEWGKDQVIVGKVGLIGEPVGSPLPPPGYGVSLRKLRLWSWRAKAVFSLRHSCLSMCEAECVLVS